MDISVKGIILKTKDYKENDKLLTILTLEKGKILVNAKGVKKPKSKLKAFCQSFCFADFELTKSSNGYILTGVNQIESFFDLTSNINKFSYAFAVLEIADKICFENQAYVNVFIDCLKCLKQMNFTDVEPKLIFSKFILSILKYEGVNLNLNKCNCCKTPFVSDVYLDMNTGEVLCVACKNLDCIKLDKAVFSVLKILSREDYEKLSTIKFSAKILDATLNHLLQHLRHKFDVYIKSIDL
ncbi:MAG: DNA repair protein RecO [Clostridia bacterium]|nr:DNA repair protein RecO [Clostridia bacterium]